MSTYETLYTIISLLILCITLIICLHKKKYNKFKNSYTTRLMSSSSINNDLSIEKAEIELVTNHKLLL